MRRPGVTLSRDELVGGGWDMSFEHRSNIVDVYHCSKVGVTT